MSAGTEHRKLTAIIPLCGTDMVGYSARSQRNEALALDSLEKHRGRFVNTLSADLESQIGRFPQGRALGIITRVRFPSPAPLISGGACREVQVDRGRRFFTNPPFLLEPTVHSRSRIALLVCVSWKRRLTLSGRIVTRERERSARTWSARDGIANAGRGSGEKESTQSNSMR